ncbi:MAG: DNA methyltransferase [Bdellovibrionaceae bacterium]|nr:DNA methyltransferase [Pseudobdellovibrionaceae bacterium]
MEQQFDFFAVKQNFLYELKNYIFSGKETRVKVVNDVPYFINEFWTSKQRQARRIHEISYRACFKPQLPAFFIDRLSNLGDIVYDPFMGRGTTAIESALRGRIPYGNDINPLSKALTKPRINPPNLDQIINRLAQIPWKSFKTIQNKKLLVFYHPKTLKQIEGLRAYLINQKKLDRIDSWIRMVDLNLIIVLSSGFFSIFTLPPNQAVSIERQKKINQQRNQKAIFKDVPAIIAKKSANLLSQSVPQVKKSLFLTELSYQTKKIPRACVQLTVTSPPFLDIVNYTSDNWLRCWFLGIDSQSIPITKYKNIEDWTNFIAKTLKELARITRPKGYIAFEVGEVRRGKIKLEESVILATKKLPLTVLGVMINQQNFTKTANCWGISNNKNGTNSNRIVLMQ